MGSLWQRYWRNSEWELLAKYAGTLRRYIKCTSTGKALTEIRNHDVVCQIGNKRIHSIYCNNHSSEFGNGAEQFYRKTWSTEVGDK